MRSYVAAQKQCQGSCGRFLVDICLKRGHYGRSVSTMRSSHILTVMLPHIYKGDGLFERKMIDRGVK